MASVSTVTPKKREKFLAELANGVSISGAAKAAGFDRRTAYRHRAADKEFAEEWDAAVEAGTDALEDEAKKRAVDSSDTLLIFLLKGRRPEKYRERVEHTGKDGGPVQVTSPAMDAAAQELRKWREDMSKNLEPLTE